MMTNLGLAGAWPSSRQPRPRKSHSSRPLTVRDDSEGLPDKALKPGPVRPARCSEPHDLEQQPHLPFADQAILRGMDCSSMLGREGGEVVGARFVVWLPRLK